MAQCVLEGVSSDLSRRYGQVLILLAFGLVAVLAGRPARAQATCGSSSQCSKGHTINFQNNCNSGVNMVAQYSCQTVSGTTLCLPNAPTSAADSGCCGPYNPGWLTAMQAANGTVASGTCQPGSITSTEVFKNACPTAYSYQFDDPSSSYQCSDSKGEVNYLVTFCPVAAKAGPKKGR
ncbi:MAG TPA: hypothetical protein VGX68_21090 [Thermoanaerobaculia bacterium]|jgi:hypothetical protein|nr:hypothetical protein [Thermoanaerobaculia bacterium]